MHYNEIIWPDVFLAHESAPDFVRYNTDRPTAMFIAAFAAMTGARSAIELGTYKGYTTCHLIWALGPEGRVVTVDANDQRIDCVKELPHTFVEGMLPDILGSVPGTFDLAFIDSTHEPQHTRSEIAALRPMMTAKGHYLFHDANRINRLQDLLEGLVASGEFRGIVLPTPPVPGEPSLVNGAGLGILQRV